GGVLPKLNLGKLLPGGIFDRSSQNAVYDEPPAAYDASTPVRQRPQATASPAASTAIAADLPAARYPSAGATVRSGSTVSPASRPTGYSSSTTRSNGTPVRTAQRSPVVGRSSELAAALHGLNDDQVVAADDSESSLPSAANSASVPSYLQDLNSRAVQSVPSRTATSTGVRGGYDLGEALRRASQRDEIAAQAAAAAAATDAAGSAVSPSSAPAIQSRGTRDVSSALSAAANRSRPAAAVPSDEEASVRKARSAVAEATPSQAASKPVTVASPRVAQSTPLTASTGDRTPAVVESSAQQAVAPNPNLLLSFQQPMIGFRVEGPRQITVGREARYRVTLGNAGQTEARDLVATIEIPSWADVADSRASNGVVENANDATEGNTRQLSWRLYTMPGGAQQTLELMLIPREGRDLQLGVHWTHAPVGTEAVVEVQEPMLDMEISGPADVLYGDPQRYTLSLSNPGTGAAEDVKIELMPPGGDEHSLVTHPVGELAPGDRKTIELELTAREAGELTVRATALATGGLRAETVKNVLCRKSELEIDWRGPDEKYAGTTATYYFRVRNPGTAASSPVNVELKLPTGAEFVNASDGFNLSDAKDAVVWRLSGLRPEEEQFMEVQCRLTRPGANSLTLTAATTDGKLTDAKTIAANVVALADLKLEIVDPKGPIPVGEAATYTIHIRNRGTTEARGINVIGLFSDGIEPTSVQGGQHSINDGRIAFRTIESLPAGGELTLKIDAEAKSEGTHLFRAEVVCEDLDIKLSAEETTRFFVDEFRWDNASNAYSN
ncbi:MAG: hypothetical protein KDA61_07490, partial [Planctomycetales bacterium]|nr:hypothetical protein [Planctomycetales bacterium]